MASFRKTILLAFCISNVSAIMYQVVWGRELGYIFGTSMYAVSTVLTSFMTGLALGSYLFGRIADNYNDPVRLFSYLQISIGIYGVAMIAVLKLLPYFYLYLYDIFSWNNQIFMFTLFVLSFISLIIPTTLMGGTFPVIGKIYSKEIKTIGQDIGTVYSADTIGACFGAILGGFVLMPLWGLSKTIIFAVILNIFSGIYILKMRLNAISRKGVKNVKS